MRLTATQINSAYSVIESIMKKAINDRLEVSSGY